MSFATVRRCALCRIELAYSKPVLIDMSFVDEMQMIVVQIIRMSVMLNCRVPALLTMHMLMLFMDLTAHGFLLINMSTSLIAMVSGVADQKLLKTY
jgi:hypothetical protein